MPMSDKEYIIKSETNTIVLPADVLEILGRDVVVARAVGGRIGLYPLNKWEELIKKLSMHLRANMKVQRFLISHAEEAVIDSEGRLFLPEPLRDECVGEMIIRENHGMIEMKRKWDNE